MEGYAVANSLRNHQHKLDLHHLRIQYTTRTKDMPSKATAPTSLPKSGPLSRKRAISITAEVMGNKRSRRSTRLTKDELEEQEEEEEEVEEEVEAGGGDMDVDADMGMDVDVDVDMDKPAKGGRQGKKEKKGGKAGKGKKAEEKWAEEKKYVFNLILFFCKINWIC
jgi:hypothetical protein